MTKILKLKKTFVALLCIVLLTSCSYADITNGGEVSYPYTQETYTVVNGNVPEFAESEITPYSFEYYSELDYLGRCGTAFACIGEDLMPTAERGAIGQIKPSGWNLVKYDIVEGKYLYNRCHLIGYQLSGENANKNNLITGTRYFNTEGMLPFENMVADYVRETKNHVMYRVTPVFEGKNLVAKGVKMEALSVEDAGKGISFNVFVNNIQPGIIIDYSDGTSSLDDNYIEIHSKDTAEGGYVLNTNTKRFHYASCQSAHSIKEKNRETFLGTKEELAKRGYLPCGVCKP